MENYRFNKERHLHQLLVDGIWKNLTGCTTVLNVISKLALIPWAANMTAKFLEPKLKEIKEIVEKIGDKQKIDGIEEVFGDCDDSFGITANNMEVARDCYGDLKQVHCADMEADSWTLLEDPTRVIEEWFSYVEEKVDQACCTPKEITVDGHKYKLVK